MAVIAVAGIGAYLGTGATGVAAGIIAVATAAAAIGATYLDSRFIYPSLFGSDDPQTPTGLFGLDQMTGEDGAPGHRVWGRSAVVGGHCMFFENLQTFTQRTSDKKSGAGATFVKRTALVGVGWAHGRVAGVNSIIADQKRFWLEDFDQYFWTDYRCTIEPDGGATKLILSPTTSEAADLYAGGSMFVNGDMCKISNSPTAASNGYWRVAAVRGLGDPVAPFGRMELTPLEGQTPVSTSPGTPASPIEIRRVDAGVAGVLGGGVIESGSFGLGAYYGLELVCISTVSAPRLLPSQWAVVGSVIRVSGCSPTYINGRYECVGVRPPSYYVPPNRYGLVLRAMDGQSGASTTSITSPGGATNPTRVVREDEGGFLEVAAGQEHLFYTGNETDGPDVDLAAIYGSGVTHGYRGIARSVLRGLNISNFGDRAPQFSGTVRAADRHTTLDVFRDVLLDAHGVETAFDLSGLEPNPLLGYTQRGLQKGTTTMQPVAIAYGIESQDVGGKWRLFKAEDADLHVLEERELGAYRSNDRKPTRRFMHQRIQDRDMPRRLSLFYRDPMNDHTRTERMARSASDTGPAGEDVVVDVDPLVMYPWDAQNAVNRLFAQALIGRDQGTINLPPSRCDVLPNDRLTFTALNWNEENLTLDGDGIDHTTQIADIEVGSVSMEVDLEFAGSCRLIDREHSPGYGSGYFVGYPASVTPLVNSIDYATGQIQFVCGTEILHSQATSGGTTTTLNDTTQTWTVNEHAGKELLVMSAGWQEILDRVTITSNSGTQMVFPALGTAYGDGTHYMIAEIDADSDRVLSGRVRYEFPNPWRMRVQGQTCYRNRIFEQQLVAVAERFPIVGSPVEVNTPQVPIVVRPAVLSTHVLDIAAIVQWFADSPGVFFAAAPQPGSAWRGAGVYVSTDDISYTLLEYIQQPTTMGTATDHLATADVGVVDWSQTLSVRLADGELSDASFDQIGSGFGQNWALYGDEILAFHSAVLETDGSYTLSGFVRGLRDTADAVGTHADGERFVLLTNLGIAELSGVFHEFPLPTDLGRTVYCKIVPTGGDLDDYDAVQVTWKGENVRCFAPTSIVQGDLATYGYDVSLASVTYDADDWLTNDVVVRWFRRTRSIAPMFGAGSAVPVLDEPERYLVEVLLDGDVVRTEMVGGPNTGGPMVHRTFRYTVADQIADLFASGDTATFRIRQVGRGGENRLSRAATITWTVP